MLCAVAQVLAASAAVAQAEAPASAAVAQAESPASAYLGNSHKFKQLLNAVSVDDKALKAMNGILLVPSDGAIEGLAKSMGMSMQQLLANPLLVDQITAYHFLPRVTVSKKPLKVANMPILSKTGAYEHSQ